MFLGRGLVEWMWSLGVTLHLLPFRNEWANFHSSSAAEVTGHVLCTWVLDSLIKHVSNSGVRAEVLLGW